jgi:hypothetical protein
MVVGAVSLALVAIMIERDRTLAESEFNYTEFWMVPDAAGGAVTLTVKNEEAAASTYDVEVSIDGNIAQVWRDIPLAVGETWQTQFTLPAEFAGSKGVQAWLFKDNDYSLVYRRVWLPAPAGE